MTLDELKTAFSEQQRTYSWEDWLKIGDTSPTFIRWPENGGCSYSEYEGQSKADIMAGMRASNPYDTWTLVDLDVTPGCRHHDDDSDEGDVTYICAVYAAPKYRPTREDVAVVLNLVAALDSAGELYEGLVPASYAKFFKQFRSSLLRRDLTLNEFKTGRSNLPEIEDNPDHQAHHEVLYPLVLAHRASVQQVVAALRKRAVEGDQSKLDELLGR